MPSRCVVLYGFIHSYAATSSVSFELAVVNGDESDVSSVTATSGSTLRAELAASV